MLARGSDLCTSLMEHLSPGRFISLLSLSPRHALTLPVSFASFST